MALLRPFRGNTFVLHIMGNPGCSWFVMVQAGGGALPNFYLGNFKGFFAATSWAAAMASTTTGIPLAPISGQRTCFPHHGQLLVHSVCYDSRGGLALPNFYPGNFKGCRHIMGNRHGLYRRRWPSGAHSRGMRLLTTSWVTPGVLGLL
jgi:hypothetical protein